MNADEEIPYWWCPECEANVLILIAHNVGLFCRQCGIEVESPPNISNPSFYDIDDLDHKSNDKMRDM